MTAIGTFVNGSRRNSVINVCFPRKRIAVGSISSLNFACPFSRRHHSFIFNAQIKNGKIAFQTPKMAFQAVQSRLLSVILKSSEESNDDVDGSASTLRGNFIDLPIDCEEINTKFHDTEDEFTAENERKKLIGDLSKDVARSVLNIIHTIDSRKALQVAGTTSDEKKPTPGKRPQKTLMERWNVAVTREDRRFRQRNPDLFPRKAPFHEVTVQGMWDQVFQQAGNEVLLMLDNMEISDTSDTINSNEVEGSEALLSPILGVEIDTNSRIDETTLDPIDERMNNLFDVDTLRSMAEKAQIENLSRHSNKHSSDTLLKAIREALSLFSVVSKNEWKLLSTKDYKQDSPCTNETILDKQRALHNQDDDAKESGTISVQPIMDFAQRNRLTLTCTECNIILAHILTSANISSNHILGQSLQFLDEMNKLASLGIEECRPDSNTYRLLFLGLSRRVGAIGEAAQICRSLAADPVDLSHETLLEAMRICKAYGDIDTAAGLLKHAIDSDSGISLTLGPCSIYIDMLKDRNMMKEAFVFFNKIKEGAKLHNEQLEEILFQLCRWPNRTRQGNAIDCTPILVNIFEALHSMSVEGPKPPFQLWFLLLERLVHASKLDPSLQQTINYAVHHISDAYPNAWLGNGLMRIGLQSAQKTLDSKLMPKLLSREIEMTKNRVRQRNVQTKKSVSTKIPITVFRKALEVSLQTGDVDASASLMKSFQLVEGEYPKLARSELYALATLCYAGNKFVLEAKEMLLLMVSSDLKPGDDVFGTVLQSLILGGNGTEALQMFEDMKNSTNNLPKPGVFCYNAITLAYIEEKKWSKAVTLFHEMKENSIQPNAQSIQGCFLAYIGLEGKTGALKFLDDQLDKKKHMNESIFQLISRMSLPGSIPEDTEEIRKFARNLSETYPFAREEALQLIRKARIAENEMQKGKLRNNYSGESLLWTDAVTAVLEFKKALDREV